MRIAYQVVPAERWGMASWYAFPAARSLEGLVISERGIGTVLERVRKVSQQVIGPAADGIDAEGMWPTDGIRALQAAGVGGLVVPARFGGIGQGLHGLVRVCEEIATECASTAICFGMHHVGTAVIAAKATDYHVERYLRPIAEGKHLTTLALSETGTGIHFYLPQTRLAAQGAGYRVDGKKAFVTNGGSADSYVVSTVAAAADAPPGMFSCVVLDRGTQGMSWGSPWRGFGMRGNASLPLSLSSVRVPSEALLGVEGDEIWYFFHVIAPYFLAAMSGTYLGLAARAVEEATAHLRMRTYGHSASGPGSESVVQHKLGSIWAQLERTRRLIYWAALDYDEGGARALAAIFSAKAEVADCAVDVVNEALTLTGGIGYSADSLLHRLLRDARAAHVMSPTTDLLRVWTGRALLDQPILGD